MRKIKDILVLGDAVDDLNRGKSFYDEKEPRVGDYFWDSMIADVESLVIYAGIHEKRFGLFRMLAKRFPYGVYYEIVDETVRVIAVLPIRRDPTWIRSRLKERG